MKTIIYGIDGMSCGHCVKAVERALRGVTGVHSVEVSLTDRLARVTVDLAIFQDSVARDAIASEGYTIRSAT
jgi:copper chaperone CopZ